jgi:hypothetical protein
MSEHSKGPQPGARKYEDSSLNSKSLFWFAVGLVAMVLAGVVISAVTFKFFVKMTPMGPNAAPFEDVRQMPTGVRLQTKAPQDLETYRKNQDNILNNYGWVDQPNGVVRIPIERAIELMLQKGYPVRANGEAQAAPAKNAKGAPAAHHQAASEPAAPEGKHS